MSKNIVLLREAKISPDIIQVFVTSKKELDERLVKLKPHLGSKGVLWVTYPRGSSRIKADINRDVIREAVLSVGLEAVAIFSLAEDWSALRLKTRLD